MSIHLQKEIDKLGKKILFLGAVVEKNLQAAVQALIGRDEKMALTVQARDVEIDHLEVELEEDCLKVLALYQPVAIDLRFIVAVLKINSDLERIGDLAVNIAERGLFLSRMERVQFDFDFPLMARKAEAMVKKSLDALVNMDTALAREVCASDDEIDDLNRQMFRKSHEAIQKAPEKVDQLINYLQAVRQLERIADHATNIAEDVIYMVEGEIVRHRLGSFLTEQEKK